MGDAVLVAIANVLAANLRDGDVLARWGGEEFLALMPYCPLEAACATAERIRAAIAQAPLDVTQAPIALDTVAAAATEASGFTASSSSPLTRL